MNLYTSYLYDYKVNNLQQVEVLQLERKSLFANIVVYRFWGVNRIATYPIHCLNIFGKAKRILTYAST